MKVYTRNILGMALAVLVVALAPALVRAEVTRVEITSRQDVLAGKTFGTAGAYEKLIGKVYFAVDPKNPQNRIIADLDKAPRNKQGKVEFSSDLFILKPKDPSKGNGVAFFDVLNRGNLQFFVRFNLAKGSADPTTEAEFGDGFLMREGYTLVAVGWQFDVKKFLNPKLIGLDAPIATDHGKPITGSVSQWFVPDKAIDSYEFTSGPNTKAYPPLDPNDPADRLTERDGWAAAQRLVPREDWQFGRMENGQVMSDPNWLYLKSGFKPGQTYQITYESKDPPVAGLGFAAVRDMASAIKYKSDAIVHAQYVYTTGESQTGRFNRQIVYEGFTTDEQGRQAIDALLIRVGGTSLGPFNVRFATPNDLGVFTETRFPIRYEVTTDPVTGKRDGLGARVPAGQAPKIFLFDSGSEYWNQGRVAAILHTSTDGRQELPDPPNVRVFYVAGTKHVSSGAWPPAELGTQQLPDNPINYLWVLRGLLVRLDGWARKGVAPPPSMHPQLSDGTLVAQRKIKFPNVPGVQWPLHVPGGFRADLPGATSVLPFLVSQVDSDGNDVGGIRTPEQAVPLGTYTGWAFRSERSGAPDTLVFYSGSYIPFAKTRAEREHAHDPRPSVEERYPDRADYTRRVEEAANTLVQQGYLLQEDVKPIVEDAAKHWDWTMSAKTSQAAN